MDVSDLDNNDLRVTGPGGFSADATFVSVNVASDGTPRMATYEMSAPGGAWDASDNGIYSVELVANEVSDTSGNFASGGILGTFTVTINLPGPVGRWGFDETSGNVAQDAAGGDHNATLIDSAVFVNDALRGRVLSLSGSHDRAMLDTALDLGNPWTISAWFKDLGPGGWRTLTRGQAGDHQILVNPGGLLGSYDNVGGSGFHSSGFSMNSLSADWHHVAAVGGGGSTTFYIDGVQVGVIGFQSTTDVKSLGNTFIGTQRFASFLDEARVHNHALTNDGIAALVNPNPAPLLAAGGPLGTSASSQAFTADALQLYVEYATVGARSCGLTGNASTSYVNAVGHNTNTPNNIFGSHSRQVPQPTDEFAVVFQEYGKRLE